MRAKPPSSYYTHWTYATVVARPIPHERAMPQRRSVVDQATAVITTHDDYLIKLRLTPLPENCEPARFDQRVSEALEQHIPFLSRPFAALKDVSVWIIEQLPSDLSVHGQWLTVSR